MFCWSVQLTSVGKLGSCQFSNNVCPEVASPTALCQASSPNPFQFPGGVVGLPAGITGYYALALYWAPTSCLPKANPSPGGFCSEYTYVSDTIWFHPTFSSFSRASAFFFL